MVGLLGLAALAGLVGALVLGQFPAIAEPAAGPNPGGSAAPTLSPVTPTITVADAPSSTTRATGTATPGASLRILDPTHPASSLCTTTAASDGSWYCSVTVSSGADQRLTLRDLTNTQFADVISEPFSILAAPAVSTSAGVSVGARLQGTAFAGATVTLTLVEGGYSTEVRTTVASDGSWSSVLPASTVPTGTYSVTGVQSSTAVPKVPVSSASSPLSVSIDREAPPAPRLLHPAAGSTVSTQPLTFDGNGQNGATVTTYVDSNPVCTAVVKNGYWSCTSAGLLLPSGTRSVQAAQRDAAGNYGAPSAAVKVDFAKATPSSTPSAPSTNTPGQAPGSGQTPSDPGSSSTAEPSVPGGGGSTGGGSGSAGGPGSGGAVPGDGGAGTHGSAAAPGSALSEASSWTASTGFGRSLPTLSESVGGSAWAWALLLGLVFVALVLAPMRLAASALGGRLAMRARHLTGRNRSRRDDSAQPALSPAAAVATALAAGALLVALAAGVDDQVRYVRLAVAIVIGLGLINGLGIVLPTWIAGRRLGLRLRLTLSPRLLLAAALACLATRILDLDPPMVLGVLLAAGLVDTAGRDLDEIGDVRRGGIVATAQLGSLALVSLVAWVAHGLVPAGNAVFAVEITRETLATVCLAGLGSLIVLLVPVGRLPGRALYSWSKPTLVGLAIVGVAAAAVVYAGGPAEAFPIGPLVVAAIAFAVVALGAWAWVRFVEPATDDYV